MNLHTALVNITPHSENSYQEFSNILDKAYTESSIWGTKNVYAVGYSGSVSLEKIHEKLDALSTSNSSSSGEKEDISSFQRRLLTLYRISEEQVKRRSIIRSVFLNFRIGLNPSETEPKNLQATLNTITPYTENSYATFNHIMENAYSEFSIWGTRRVYAIGYTGCVYLEDICFKINALAKSNPQFSEEERAIGKAMRPKLEKLYKVSEEQVRRRSILSDIFLNTYMLLTFDFSWADPFYFGVSEYAPFG